MKVPFEPFKGVNVPLIVPFWIVPENGEPPLPFPVTDEPVICPLRVGFPLPLEVPDNAPLAVTCIFHVPVLVPPVEVVLLQVPQ